MTDTVRILAFAGSTRKASWNRKVLAVAADGGTSAGANLQIMDLNDYPLPLYDGDLEEAEGAPPNVQKIKNMMADASGYLIACPEYNSSITPLLKNTIDWTTRPGSEGDSINCWKGKVIGLVAASSGSLGGLRGLRHVREILTNIGAIVIPDQRAVSGVNRLFDDNGRITDEKTKEQLHSLGRTLVETAGKLI